jgi:hypothetical protein
MGLLQRLGIRNKYEQGANYELGHSLSSTSVSSLFGKGGKNINVLEEYGGIAWKCIDIRAERLADQDLFVERLVGKKWQLDDKHDFNAILEGGDGQYDQSELLEATRRACVCSVNPSGTSARRKAPVSRSPSICSTRIA